MGKIKLKEKGITLIALIVTIIILLILAGVTIANVVGSNGLFEKTQKAAEKYKEESNKEDSEIKKFDNDVNKQLQILEQDSQKSEIEKNEVIKFSYNHNWTNQDLEITIEQTVGEGYTLEYKMDGMQDWKNYNNNEKPKMQSNGNISARLINLKGEEVKNVSEKIDNIDKNNPEAGTMDIRLESEDGEKYIEGTVANGKVYLSLKEGKDGEGESGHKSTIYNVYRGEDEIIPDTNETKELSENGEYTINVTTIDNANNKATREYTVVIENYVKQSVNWTHYIVCEPFSQGRSTTFGPIYSASGKISYKAECENNGYGGSSITIYGSNDDSEYTSIKTVRTEEEELSGYKYYKATFSAASSGNWGHSFYMTIDITYDEIE